MHVFNVPFSALTLVFQLPKLCWQLYSIIIFLFLDTSHLLYASLVEFERIERNPCSLPIPFNSNLSNYLHWMHPFLKEKFLGQRTYIILRLLIKMGQNLFKGIEPIDSKIPHFSIPHQACPQYLFSSWSTV